MWIIDFESSRRTSKYKLVCSKVLEEIIMIQKHVTLVAFNCQPDTIYNSEDDIQTDKQTDIGVVISTKKGCRHGVHPA